MSERTRAHSEADHSDGPGSPRPVRPEGLTTDEEVGYYVEMWKQAVAVQMHFNDIAWRIRGLALTVATFALGAAAVAARDGASIGRVSLGAVVLLLGLLLWYGFYFVDRYWYHPLLRGAVRAGTEMEVELNKHLGQARLIATISEASPQTAPLLLRRWRKQLRSEGKLGWFYLTGGLALAAAAVGLQVAVLFI